MTLLPHKNESAALRGGTARLPSANESTPGRIVLAEWEPTSEPLTLRAIGRVHEDRFTIEDATLRRLGLGISPETVVRLVKGGFVVGRREARGRYTFSLASYYAHCDRVRAASASGGTFWTKEKRRRFRATSRRAAVPTNPSNPS